MHEDSLIHKPLGIPPIQIGREPLLGRRERVFNLSERSPNGGLAALIPHL